MSQPSAGKSAPPQPPVPNPRPQVFLFVAVTLFTLWTAFMAYLAVATVKPIVVSQPQIYVAPVVVEAQLAAEPGSARDLTVTKVYRGQKLLGVSEDEQHPKDLKITVSNLGEAVGWRGDGEYILALQPSRGAFDLVATPGSPGFPPPNQTTPPRPAVYPATESTRAQTLRALRLSEPGP